MINIDHYPEIHRNFTVGLPNNILKKKSTKKSKQNDKQENK